MKIFLPLAVSFVAVISIFTFQFVSKDNKDFLLVFCNVGEGDAIYMRIKKLDVLVDGGHNEKVVDCLNRHMPLYDKNIEIMIMSHADIDHYGGLIDVLDSYTVSNFATSPGDSEIKGYVELMNKLNDLGVTVRRLTQGNKIKVGEGVLDVLWPPVEFAEIDSDRNNSSVVLLVEYQGFTTLLTGDLDKEYLNILLHDLNHVNVFKLSHHGSRTGTNDETFENFTPDLSIISAGRNNRYGHPHREAIDALKKYNLKYKTTFGGDVVIEM